MKKTLMHVAAAIAAVAIFTGGTALGAEDALELHGYGRTKAGALVDDGDYFIAENTVDLRLSYEAGPASFYANPVLSEQERVVQSINLREAYIDLGGNAFGLRMGKQQIIWGKGDGVFITDIVSPKDLSRFLIPDFEELRLAVTGVKLDLYAGTHSVELVYLPWFTPSVAPDATSLWAPSMPFPITPAFLPADMPAMNIESGEYFAKYSFMGSAFDASLMGGWMWNDTPSYAVISKTPGPGGLTALTVQGEYYRTAAAGYTVSGIAGPFVLRSEGAWYGGRRYQGNPMVYPDGYAEKNALQYLVGTDFSVAGVTFGFQFIQDIILDHEDDLVDEAVKGTATMVMAKTFFRETVTAEVFSYIGIDAPDALVKPKITWKAADALELFTGAYMFFGDESGFGQYDDKDGVYLGAKLSF